MPTPRADASHSEAATDEAAIKELGGIRNIRVDVPKPEGSGQPHRFSEVELQLPAYETGGKEATRKAYRPNPLAPPELLGRYMIAFEGAAVLILLGMVGAVIFARRA